ncbi:TIGR04283 family arsenosugar biosynthesis glycosyltransferase [Ascidiimonas aurantiaca]|uniref:TIGR04283 family arsenosugar biosynthesis glycosyltransferase n=1 Tax=Ascidiimonas aurantiaca TaxID=1685432 RepID=UPI0030EDD97F
MKISIIIPALNEAENLQKLLPYLKSNTREGLLEEIIVVDGGSSDHTEESISKFEKVRCIKSKRGRALQMNAGARAAKGEILYFVHADSYPPENYGSQIQNAVKKGHLAGCFRLRFNNKHPLLRASQWFTRFNVPVCRGGDQSLFITKALFEKMGGYNELYVIYEDNEFTGRLYQNKVRFTVLPDSVITSARKYEAIGYWKLQFYFTVIHLKKFMGASPHALYKYYQRKIASR